MMTLHDVLGDYGWRFQRLKRANTPYGKAPHKPVLLLAVMHLIEKGTITENRLYLTPELVAEFVETFKILVHTGNRPEFSLPFYHLQGEKFWHLQLKPDMQLKGYIKSIAVLNEIVEYAYLDEPLFGLLQNPETRLILKMTLLDTYFPDTKVFYLAMQPNTDAYMLNLEKYILKEPNTAYGPSPSLENEEEQFVRGSLFKKMIPRLYNNTCSITRMRVDSTHGYQLIDACHIKPISISNDDTVSNGFALCPNLHRAFDRGMIGIDDNYRVVVSKHIKEDPLTDYSLKRLEGTALYLPMPEKYYPAKENFLWHLGGRFER